MITTENKYFLRIILLLYDAASFILRHIVVRELKKHGDDINNLLTKAEFENKLKHILHFGKSQVDKLFPSNSKSDIQTWDSQMLAVVSLLIFRSTLSGEEKYHIKFIKLTRNNVAHKPSASYLEDDFVDEKEGIVKAITTLASTFDTTVQENCRKLISSYCSDLFDIQLAIKHLEEDTTNRELLRQILDAVNEKHELVRKDIQEHAEKIENKIHLTEKKICESQDTVLNSLNGLCLGIGNVESKVTESKETSSKELKQVNASLTNHIVKESEKVSQKVDSNNSLLQKLQNCQNEHAAKVESKLEELKQLFEQTSRTGSHCSKQIKFGTHTHLTVDGPTQEWINIVETVLKSVFDLLLNNVQEPGRNPETEKAVEEFLNFIKGFKGVELKAVERKCILLAFECLTYESLREFIEFINSNEFLSYLENIARALERDLQIPNHITISSEIPVSSLQLVVDDKSLSIKHESEKGIELSFECTSIDGLDAFWCLFGKGEATPYIDKIAATLSSEVREQTSISTIVDLREFEDALTHLEATVNREKETVLFKPNEESPRQSPDLEPDIDTLKTRTDGTCIDGPYKRKWGEIDGTSTDELPMGKRKVNTTYEPQNKQENEYEGYIPGMFPEFGDFRIGLIHTVENLANMCKTVPGKLYKGIPIPFASTLYQSLITIMAILTNVLRDVPSALVKKLCDSMTTILAFLKKIVQESGTIPEWISGIIQRAAETKLSDKLLIRLAGLIGKNWEILGLELGLNPVEIDHISADHKSTAMAIFAMLRKWMTSKQEEAKACDLLLAMWNCKEVNVNWKGLATVFI